MEFDTFDLQKFADEGTDENTLAPELDSDGAGEGEEEKEPIPPELEGLSEDTAREAMTEAKSKEAADDSGDNSDSDGQEAKNDSGAELPKTKVPYVRFKEQVDKTNSLSARNKELEAKLAEYERRFGGANAEGQIQTSQIPAANASEPPQVQSLQGEVNFTPEVAKKFQEAVKQRAKQVAGFSDDDVESLAYAEEDDERIAAWKYAQEFARQEIVGKIRQAQEERFNQAKAFLENHRKMEADFNEYATKAMAEEDFPQIQKYAEGTFLQQFSPGDQQVIGDAYRRIINHVGSGQDYYTIKNFYLAAKNAYRSGQGKTAAKQKAAQNFPKAAKVQGNSGGDGVITAESLLAMAEKTPWEEIPPKYRDMLMGITPIG